MDALGIHLKDSDFDDEELASLAFQLRDELLELDVSDVSMSPKEGQIPEGAKGLDLAVVGSLLVSLVAKVETVKKVVSTIREWLARQRLRSIEITLEGDTLKLTNASAEDQERLVEAWVSRHAGTE
jgi:hypothetical protein